MTSKGSPSLCAPVYGPEMLGQPINPTIRLDIYQRWLKERYDEFEEFYNAEVDDLAEKLDDLEIPMLETRVNEFTFITDWLTGKISSKQCYSIFKSMDLEEVSNTRVIRKFVSHMFKHTNSADYLKETIAILRTKGVPLYRKYLFMLRKYFEVLARVDEEQVPLTWLEQVLPENASGEIKTHIHELPMNQFIHTMDNFILGAVEKKYCFDKNVVVFDEVHTDGRVIHWIFGPEAYIDLLKTVYNIKELIKGEQEEKTYLTKLLQDYK